MKPPQFSCNKHRRKLSIPAFALALVLLISLTSPTSCCTEQEKGFLFQFLAELSQDDGLAMSWRNDTSCCAWEGITCNGNGAVIKVSLASRELEGRISPSLGALAGLLHLNLSHNSLSGYLPQELVHSRSIIVLDVSFNRLSGNLQELPSSAAIQPLQVLNISSNLFTGQLPSATWETMKNLVVLNASNNSFTGEIPTHFCNSSPAFEVLELCYNQFIGGIPPRLGGCSMLRVLKVGHNNLNGTLPDELFNATLLEYISFPNNGLEGKIDGTLVVKLSNLTILDLGGNNFSGKIPDSVGQLSRLQELHLDHNNMYSELPSALGNCKYLTIIDLKGNRFSGDLSKVNFSNLLDLKTLDLMSNHFTGTIPESIYSCSNLIALRLSSNHFYGELSPGIGKLKYLSFLSLANNSFTDITKALQILKGFRNLTTLLIGSNFRKEAIPQDETIDGFENLHALAIENCSLSGKIPLWLLKLTNLEMLFMSDNELTGVIPGWISSLNNLFYLDISNNRLTGEIPITLMEMKMLQSMYNQTYLDPRFFELPVYTSPYLQYRLPTAFPTVLNLSKNNFTGVISPKIGQLKMLVMLDLSSNNLSGKIPQSICNLTSLRVLILSNNHLTGAIPGALSTLNFLSALNVSNNDLEGQVPTGGQFSTFDNSSFDGNPKLCGPILNRSCGSAKIASVSKNHRNKKIILAIAFSVFFGGIAIIFLLGRLLLSLGAPIFITKNKRESSGDGEAASFRSGSEHSFVMMLQGNGGENKLNFPAIVRATNNFNKEQVIGCGGYGLVYKAELPDGPKLAIKKLNGEMCLMEREFTAEVEALSMAQHENLVPLWGYCVQGNSRLLIYSYMENGSLDDWLHNRDDDASSFLDWPIRLKIAQGASRGLFYIHDVCKPHIIHRDIKSSNILLDKEFKAYVADFGLSRLILPSKTHVTTELVGTLGYIPPEYGQAWVATLRGDMYSFGVVLLELLTGRRPIPVLSTSKELVPWVLEMRSEGKEIEVLDPTLKSTGYLEQMLKVLEVACKCVNRDPFMRPAIMEVVSCLEIIDDDLQTQNTHNIEYS